MSDQGDRLEADRVKRARASIEETVEGLRARVGPSRFVMEKAPEEARTVIEYRAREDQRIANERAGHPTKPFSEMDGLEIYFAMASYHGPGHYPPELESIASRMAAAPPERLAVPDQEALGEVLHIKQQIRAGVREVWMLERLYDLMQQESGTVKVEAGGLLLELAKEAYEEPDDDHPAHEETKN